MINKCTKIFLRVLFITIILISNSFSIQNKNGKFLENKFLSKTTSLSSNNIQVNRVKSQFSNNGRYFHDIYTGDSGQNWPIGSKISTIYSAGQVFAAMVNGEVRIASGMYQTEFQPGVILSPGVASDPNNSDYRVYSISTNGVGDWDNWPTGQGAPVDAQENPLLLGAQTIFSVYNDLTGHNKFSTNPLGVEVRQSAWAFRRDDEFGDVVYFKWQFVNKSNDTWEDAYFSIWVDSDLGDYSDDLAGCDTTLGLAYTYNGNIIDAFYGDSPPALGIDLLQGPIVDEAGSTITLPNGQELTDKKILPMSSFITINAGGSFSDPQTATEVYNILQGKMPDGNLITDNNGEVTTFMYYGDPVTATGWLDSSPADHRMYINMGPFNMAPWQDINGNNMPELNEPGVQEIIAAVVIGRSTDNINSVSALKLADMKVQYGYDSNFSDIENEQNASVSEVSHISGDSYDVEVKAAIHKYNEVKEHTYQVSFMEENDSLFWNLLDVTEGSELLHRQKSFSSNIDVPVVNGVFVNVFGRTDTTLYDFNRITYSRPGYYQYYKVDSYYKNGWAPTAQAIDTWGCGTIDRKLLLKNIEIRFTGEYGTPYTSGNLKIHPIKEGTGSIATFVGARLYQIKDHPLNPNPGSNDYFNVRIPFEVWDTDANEQINITIYDRKQDVTNSGDFYVFNPSDRMYCHFLHKPYSETVADVNPDTGSDCQYLTWNTVFWKTDWQKGDIINIQYYDSFSDVPSVGDIFEFSTSINATSLKSRNKTPDAYVLKQNYPNPFNPNTTIQYHIPKSGFVKMDIYNMLGQKIKTLVNMKQNPGDYSVQWNGINGRNQPVSSGIYLLRFKINEISKFQKLILLK